jgi:hypothetical protein
VPVRKDKFDELNLTQENDAFDLNGVNLNVQNGNNNNGHKSSSSSSSRISLENGTTDDDAAAAYKNYLSKFDNAISESKIKLKSLESNSK